MAGALAGKAAIDREPLSSRDRAICDAFISGTSRKELATQHGLTPARIGQILNAPHAVAHMLQQARWARFADGADEIHQMSIAQRTIAAYSDHGTTKAATGNLPV